MWFGGFSEQGLISHGFVPFLISNFRIQWRQRKVFVAVFALQDAGFRGAGPPVGSPYFFSDAVRFIKAFTVGQHHRQEVEDEDQAGRSLIPQCVGDTFTGWHQLIAQPTDVFPEYLSAATGIADLKRQTVDVLPQRTFGVEVAAHLDDERFHEA